MNNNFLDLRRLLLISGCALWIALLGEAYCQAGELSSHQKFGREIYQELIEINTTHSSGDTTKAAQANVTSLRPRLCWPRKCWVYCIAVSLEERVFERATVPTTREA